MNSKLIQKSVTKFTKTTNVLEETLVLSQQGTVTVWTSLNSIRTFAVSVTTSTYAHEMMVDCGDSRRNPAVTTSTPRTCAVSDRMIQIVAQAVVAVPALMMSETFETSRAWGITFGSVLSAMEILLYSLSRVTVEMLSPMPGMKLISSQYEQS